MIVQYIKILLTVAFGVIYIPLNLLLMKTQKWYFPMYHKDKVVYYAFLPFYWILVGITSFIGIIYEEVLSKGIHMH